MSKLLTFSKLFQIIVLCSFILPFFKSCQMGGPSAEELRRQHEADSIATAQGYAEGKSYETVTDSVDSSIMNAETRKDTLQKEDSLTNFEIKDFAKALLDSINAENDKQPWWCRVHNDAKKLKRIDFDCKSNVTDNLIQRFPILQPLLQPDEGTSGFGFFIDFWFAFLYLGGTHVGILLCLLLIVFKFLDFKKYEIPCLLLNVAGFYFVFNSYGSSFSYGTYMWGFWVCNGLWLVSLLSDLLILFLQKRSSFQR